MPGLNEDSWGYHAKDGKKFHGQGGIPYAAGYGKGDIVECRLDQSAKTISFSKNGEDLGK